MEMWAFVRTGVVGVVEGEGGDCCCHGYGEEQFKSRSSRVRWARVRGDTYLHHFSTASCYNFKAPVGIDV